LMKYHELFNDFLQLRAFISDIDSSLDNDSEMDIFINRAQHGVWLNSVTRKDRQEADAADRYNSGQIVETLSGFLTLPDSPSRVATPAPVARSTTAVLPRRTNAPPQRTSGLQAPRPRRVNAIQADPDDDTPDLATLSSDDSLDTLSREIDEIEIPPNDADARAVHSLYKAAVFALQASSPPTSCIVCGGQHRFEACEVLLNTEFLKSHYIRYCQQLRREASARASAFPAAADVPNARINFIDHNPYAALDTDEADDSADDEPSHESDFQTGRR